MTRPWARRPLDVSAYAAAPRSPGARPLSEAELADDPLTSNPLFADDRERAEPLGPRPYAHRLARRAARSAASAPTGATRRFLRTLLLAEGYGDRALRELDTGAWSVGASTPGEIALGDRAGSASRSTTVAKRSTPRYADPTAGELRPPRRAARARLAGEAGLALRPHSRLELDASVRGDRIEELRFRAA